MLSQGTPQLESVDRQATNGYIYPMKLEIEIWMTLSQYGP